MISPEIIRTATTTGYQFELYQEVAGSRHLSLKSLREDMKTGRLPYKRVGKRGRIVTTLNAIAYIQSLPDGEAPKAQVSEASEDA